MSEFFLIFCGGVIAGGVGGLLGIGGGIVIMPLLRFMLGLSAPVAAGTCVLAVFCTTASASYKHYRLGHVNVASLMPVILTGALSTAVFSWVFLFFIQKTKWLDLGIGLIFFLVAIRMTVEGCLSAVGKPDRQPAGAGRGIMVKKVFVGAVAGMLPGLFGIGTGAILVPVFSYIFCLPIKVAVGSSLTCFMLNSLISSAFKFSQGFVDVSVAVPLCVGAAMGANLGARINKNFPPALLKVLFGVVFLYVSLKYMGLFWGVHL